MFKNYKFIASVVIASLILSVAGYSFARSFIGGFVYHSPNMKKLSQLYWRLGVMDIEKDEHIDYYLAINKCGIFKDYFHNEFEWQSIREFARKDILQHKDDFDFRFEFVQPIKLQDYDLEKQRFEILEDYKAAGIRKFEIIAEDGSEDLCGFARVPYYPNGLLIELNRPLDLQYVPVEPNDAQEFIEMKLKAFRKLPKSAQSQRNLYNTRDAYLVMQAKIFSFTGNVESDGVYKFVNVLASMEGYQVFADHELKFKLHEVNFLNQAKQNVRRDIVRQEFLDLENEKQAILKKQELREKRIEEAVTGG